MGFMYSRENLECFYGCTIVNKILCGMTMCAYVSTFPHCHLKSSEYLWLESKKKSKMKEESTINYAFALKNYQQNGRCRSMRLFCEDENYDYDKFMCYTVRVHISALSSEQVCASLSQTKNRVKDEGRSDNQLRVRAQAVQPERPWPLDEEVLRGGGV